MINNYFIKYFPTFVFILQLETAQEKRKGKYSLNSLNSLFSESYFLPKIFFL